MLRSCLAAALICLAVPSLADTPRVVADIAPVHALAARVMQGVGEPELLLAPGVSPHGAALRPSQARALQEAGLIIWIGPELEPWLDKAVDALPASASELRLLGVEGTHLLEFAEDDDRAHEHEMESDDDHHADDGHDDHDGHDEAHHEHHGIDPHAWLDPRNGTVWMGAIAEELASLDPANAESYRANAAAGAAELKTLEDELTDQLTALGDIGFVTFHDAYRYFQTRFGLKPLGTITPSDAVDPSPARLAELRERLEGRQTLCALAEPQFDDRLFSAITDGRDLRFAVIDPLGSKLEPGAALYPEMLRGMAASMLDCTED